MSDLPSPHEEPAPFDARLFEPPPWVTSRFGTSGSSTDLPKPGGTTESKDDDTYEDATSEGDLGLEEDIEGITRFTLDELKVSQHNCDIC